MEQTDASSYMDMALAAITNHKLKLAFAVAALLVVLAGRPNLARACRANAIQNIQDETLKR